MGTREQQRRRAGAGVRGQLSACWASRVLLGTPGLALRVYRAPGLGVVRAGPASLGSLVPHPMSSVSCQGPVDLEPGQRPQADSLPSHMPRQYQDRHISSTGGGVVPDPSRPPAPGGLRVLLIPSRALSHSGATLDPHGSESHCRGDDSTHPTQPTSAVSAPLSRCALSTHHASALRWEGLQPEPENPAGAQLWASPARPSPAPRQTG